MKTRIIIAIVVLLTALSVAGQKAPEPVRERLNSAPKAFRTFFAKFRTAIEKNRKAEVTSMTRFPFAYGYDAGDEGTYSRAQFLTNFKHITGDFFGEYKMEKNPVFDKNDERFTISTESASHLSFVRSGNTFKFVSYYVEP
ncbi:MAG: hypothetical protein ABIU09_09745 [Pyrinomonadaceae bacterium]